MVILIFHGRWNYANGTDVQEVENSLDALARYMRAQA